MKIGFSHVNGFEINGKDLKNLIFSDFGILVYEGRELIFKSLTDMRAKIHRPTSHPAEFKVVFLSKEFGKIKELDDNTTYLVLIMESTIIIHKENIYGDSIIISGESF